MANGEETQLLKQIHEMSRDMLNDLMDIDSRLMAIEENVKLHSEIDRDALIRELHDIRLAIGAIEREDTEELKEEEIVENMNTKLRSIIQMLLG